MVNVRAVRRVTGQIARQLRDLKTIGAISAYVYNKALGNSKYAQKVISNQKGAGYSAKGKSKSEIKDLKKKVKNIAKSLENDRALHVHRVRTTFDLDAAQNAIIMNATTYGISALETAMANLRYFDPGTNALVTAAPSTGTYHRDIHVKSIVYSIEACNNYQVPCKLTLYACRPKFDTSISPMTYFTDGLTDQGAPTATSQLVHLTDSEMFKEAWNIEKSKSIVLRPGRSCKLTHTIPNFEYDFSLADTHTSSFQKRYNGFAWVQRVEGVLGHDSAADEQGFLPASADFVLNVKYVFAYDAGKDLSDISISDSADNFTNGGLVSSYPVADNIGYSAS